MRYRQHLNENKLKDVIQVIADMSISARDKKVLTDINNECSIFLKSIRSGQKCFRGSRHKFKDFGKITPRKNRLPKDTPHRLHHALDAEFKRQFGWKVRSEGVFCAPNIYISDEYGVSSYFFPVGRFEMIYSDIHQDLYVTVRDEGLVSGFRLLEQDPSTFDKDEVKKWEKEIKVIVNEYGREINTAKGALYSSSEIACRCKSYYMVNTDFVTEYFDIVFAQSQGARAI